MKGLETYQVQEFLLITWTNQSIEGLNYFPSITQILQCRARTGMHGTWFFVCLFLFSNITNYWPNIWEFRYQTNLRVKTAWLASVTAGVQPRQDPEVPSGWTASARERECVCVCDQIGVFAAGSGNALFFTVAFIP